MRPTQKMQVVEGGADRAARSGRAVFDAETDLHLDLEVGNLAVADLTTHGRHLEPVEVAHGLRCTRDTVADRLLKAVGARPDDLGDAISVVGHQLSLSVVSDVQYAVIRRRARCSPSRAPRLSVLPRVRRPD